MPTINTGALDGHRERIRSAPPPTRPAINTRESAYFIRTVGDSFTPAKFNTWGAKALAGIGHVADTIMDRSVILELRCKLPNEGVDRLRYDEPDLFNDLRSKLAKFAGDYSEAVKLARPPLSSYLNDRVQDN